MFGYLAAAASIFSAFGSISRGNAQKGAADFEAQQADYAAGQSDLAATRALEVGAYNESRVREVNRQRAALDRAGAAASGFTVEGSPLEVIAYNAAQGEMDALVQRYNAEQQAYAFRVQGFQQRQQGALARFAGQQAQTAGYMNAASSLLLGGSRFLGGGSGSTGSAVLQPGFGRGSGGAP